MDTEQEQSGAGSPAAAAATKAGGPGSAGRGRRKWHCPRQNCRTAGVAQRTGRRTRMVRGAITNFERWHCSDQAGSTRLRLKVAEARLREPELNSSITLCKAQKDMRAQRERAMYTIEKDLAQAKQLVIAAEKKVAEIRAL